MMFYLTLLFTSVSMLMILVLVFFANKLRRVLNAQLYHRAFSFFAVVAIGGMLLATVLSFTTPASGNVKVVSLAAAK